MHKSFVSFLLATLFTAGSLLAYNPPIGIPDPAASFEGFNPIDAPKPDPRTYAPGWFLPTPRVNSVQNGDAYDAYYIDNTSPNATDTSNPYGHPGKPRVTIPNVVLSAGSYVQIHGDGGTGNYRYSTAFRPRGVGTAAKPIWFVGVDNPILTADCDIGYSSNTEIAYLVFDGLHWRDAARLITRPRYDNNNFHHLVFRACVWRGTGTETDSTAIAVGGSTDYPTRTVKNIVFFNCDVGHYGDKSNPGEEVGVYPTSHVTNIWFLDGAVHDMAEDGFGGAHGGQRTSTGYFIGRTRIYNNVTNGIDIKQMDRVVISECDIFGHRKSTPYTSGAGENIVLHYSGDSTPGTTATTWKNWPDDVSVLFCKIHDADFGIVTSMINRFRAVGNTFYKITHSQSVWSNTAQALVSANWDPSSAFSGGTAIHMRGVRMSSYVAHNTIVGCDNGIQYPDNHGSYSPTGTYFRGSVVRDPASQTGYVLVGNDNWPAGVTGVPLTDRSMWQPMKMQIWGNIIADRAEPSGRDVFITMGSAGDNIISFDYNLVHSPHGASYAFGTSTVRDLAWMKANTRHQVYGSSGSPSFTNAAAGDFRLQTGSIAINAATEGTGTTAYQDYAATTGIGIRHDITGQDRPVDGRWDIGAYEASSLTHQESPPSAPTSLRVVAEIN